MLAHNYPTEKKKREKNYIKYRDGEEIDTGGKEVPNNKRNDKETEEIFHLSFTGTNLNPAETPNCHFNLSFSSFKLRTCLQQKWKPENL